MDSTKRVRQIMDLGLPVYCGPFHEANLSAYDKERPQLGGLWPDGSTELIYRSQDGWARDIKRRYKAELQAVLRKEGIDPEQITDRLLRLDLHVLKTADSQIYEFFLPAISYCEGWHVRKKK